mmetsp:Transcript_135891/g.307458  ORF Transcript_135891/g.307458 Transcript_135891/m.307458 type:complete len:186 (+) Transcript_135891:82-639(+)
MVTSSLTWSAVLGLGKRGTDLTPDMHDYTPIPLGAILTLVTEEFAREDLQPIVERFFEDRVGELGGLAELVTITGDVEHQHTWYCLYKCYVELVEAKLTEFLELRGIARDCFEAEARQALLDGDRHDAALRPLFSLLEYESFLKMAHAYVRGLPEGHANAAYYQPQQRRARSGTCGDEEELSRTP